MEETISKYRILGFVEQMELDDNLRYLTMKNDPIVVSLEMPCTFTGMKSRYTATWGNDIRACGETGLEREDLELALRRDIHNLAMCGISAYITGSRPHSLRKLR